MRTRGCRAPSFGSASARRLCCSGAACSESTRQRMTPLLHSYCWSRLPKIEVRWKDIRAGGRPVAALDCEGLAANLRGGNGPSRDRRFRGSSVSAGGVWLRPVYDRVARRGRLVVRALSALSRSRARSCPDRERLLAAVVVFRYDGRIVNFANGPGGAPPDQQARICSS
jgi:hypothetical protein